MKKTNTIPPGKIISSLMLKPIFFMFAALAACARLASAQAWQSRFSVSNYMDSGIHGFADWERNNPWQVADDLMRPDTLNSFQMSMRVESVDSANGVMAIKTTGAIFRIYRSETSKHIEISQRLGKARKTVELQLLDANGAPLRRFIFARYAFSSGRFYFRNDALELRINGDGLLMIKPLDMAITKVRYRLGFQPGYRASSPRIPKAFPDEVRPDVPHDLFNKHDVSHVFMDEYGGFGVYLLDNERERFEAGENFPSAVYDLTPGRVFWTAVFPPKPFDFNANAARKTIAASNWYSYVHWERICNGADSVLVENSWSRTHADPANTYWLVSNANKKALTNYLRASFGDELKDGCFIYFGDMALWQYWLYEYVPKQSLSDRDPYSLLKEVIRNLKAGPHLNMKALVYTSPQYFIKGSRYGSAVNPFLSAGGWQKPDYKFMAEHADRFTFAGGKQVRVWKNGQWQRMPIRMLNNFETYFAKPGNCREVDAFVASTQYPVRQFPSASREGENMWMYLAEIARLKAAGPTLDGIYMDTSYEFNLPRAYQLMRELKRRFGDDFILFRHASAKEGQDAYLPQVDAYADFVMTGEGRENYGDRQFMRYFVCTYNISNAVGVLYTPKHTGPSLIDSLLALNVRLWYPTIRARGNLDRQLERNLFEARKFWQIFRGWSPAELKRRVEREIAREK